MPPARKNVIPCDVDDESSSKRPRACHVINVADLCNPINESENKCHLMLKINKDSPEEISIKRNGNVLTVESKSEDKMYKGGPGPEYIIRQYKIPAGGYTKELGSQLSVDGISVRGPGITRTSGRVIPIYVDRVPHMKPGDGKVSVVNIDIGNVHYTHMQKAQTNKCAERKEEMPENIIIPAKTDAVQAVDAPEDNPEDIIKGTGLDEST